MKFKIGTSGYSYFWNEGKPTPLEWYIRQGFNTVEINATFYRFPMRTWIRAWSKTPEYFDFSIKVHRSITHYAMLSEKAFSLWMKFRERFRAIEDKITFWLFQLPPYFKYNRRNEIIVRRFFDELNLGCKAVVEFRDPRWWAHRDAIMDIGIIFCSVDAPGLPRDIVVCSDTVYLRIHGRTTWYSYLYSRDELDEIFGRIIRSNAKVVYIYLNNDHGMLPNGRYLMELAGISRGNPSI